VPVQKLAYLLLRLPNAILSAAPDWVSRPVVYDDNERDRICPALRRLERAVPTIRDEYLAVRARLEQVPRYHEVDALQYDLSGSASATKNWRVFFLEAMGRKVSANRRLCPATAELIDMIPGVFQSFFSILEGGKSLAGHESPYWGYLRYHLALEVPEGHPQPRMRVKDRWITWREGEGFVFDDSWNHELVNENRELRSVLIVDVARPMKGVRAAVHRLCTFIMGQTYARLVVRRSAA
jgi:aspartyl/asparaginyl beta-hydroxylase (cupin superfamily)